MTKIILDFKDHKIIGALLSIIICLGGFIGYQLDQQINCHKAHASKIESITNRLNTTLIQTSKIVERNSQVVNSLLLFSRKTP